jgi:hypothetical protein
MPAFPPEIEFLLHCLRRSLRSQDSPPHGSPEPPLAIPGGLDWSALLALAETHRILAIVYPQLAPYAPEELSTAWRAAWVHSQLLAAELESLLSGFALSGIEVLPLKGPVLAEALYGDIAARQSVDLDLLVRPQDYSAAKALLLASGFTTGSQPSTGYHWAYFREGTMVELHTHLGPLGHCPLNVEEIWSRSGIAAFREQPIRVMPEEDRTLFLCYHLLKHHCARLIWLADLSRALALLEKNGSGEYLLKTAQCQGLERLLLSACAVVRETLGTPLPSELAAAILKQPKIARSARSFIHLKLSGLSAPLLYPKLWIAPAKIERGPWRLWRRLALFAPNLRDRGWAESHRIPGPLLTPLLPVLRLLRLLGKYGFVRALKIFLFRLRG